MSLKEGNKQEKYEEVKKAHEKLFPRKKRIAHNFHAADNSNKLFNQQDIEDFGELFGVQNIDFEKVQPRSKSYYAHKIKTKSFPLLKKSQRHLKYIRHNVKSASKQRAHLSSLETFKSSKSMDTFSRKKEVLNCFQTSFEISEIKISDDEEIKYTEKRYQQGIAEIVKSQKRLKCVSNRNINTSYNKDKPKKIVLGNTEHDKKTRCEKWDEYVSFKNSGDQSNYSNKNKMKNDGKYKDKSANLHQCKDNSFKSKSSKYKVKASHSIKDYNNSKTENKCGDKSKGKKNKEHKIYAKVNQMSMDKHKTAHSHHKNDQNTILKKKKRKADLMLKGFCEDNFTLKIKIRPCHVVIEECPEISHLLSSNSRTMKFDSQNLTINKKTLLCVEDLSSTSFEGSQNIPEILFADDVFSDSCDTVLAIPIPSTENITDSTDEVMVINEPSNNFNCKISQIFSTSTINVKKESNIAEKTFSEERSEPEKTIVPSPELIDLSDEDSEIEILEVKAHKFNSSSRCVQDFDKNNLNCISTEQFQDKFKLETCHKDLKMLKGSVNAILSEDIGSSSLSKLNDHLNFAETNISKLASMKFNEKQDSSLSQPSASNADKVKPENKVKYEDEINDNATSNILNFENVVQPTISSLVDIFEKESQDLKNIQFAVKSYSNVAAGLKMLEQEKLKRLKSMKYALKKYQESKQKIDEKVNKYPSNLSTFDVNNIKVEKPFINIKNKDLKSEKNYEKNIHVDISSKPLFCKEKIIYSSMPKAVKVHKPSCKSVPDVSFIQEHVQKSNTVSSLEFKTFQEPAVADVDLRPKTTFNNLNNAPNLIEQGKPVLLNRYNPLNKSVPPCNANKISSPSNEVGSSSFILKTHHSSKSQSILSQAVLPHGNNYVTESQDLHTSYLKPSLPYASPSNFIPLSFHPTLPSVSRHKKPEKACLLQKSSEAAIKGEIKENHLQKIQDCNKVTRPVGKFCNVCGKRAVFACQGCSKVFFCSKECGENFWRNGHSEVC